MKITQRQLRRIIKEEIATVTDDAIEDVVMNILSDEGGAAGLEPIEDALEDLEDDEISLPDEPIEDIVGGVTGVKRHADGDFIDTTQLENRIRVTKRQLRRIIKEEMARLTEKPDIPDIMGAIGGGKFQPRQGLDAEVAAEALAELKNDGWLSMIQTAANDAAGDLDKLGDQVDQKLMDAGLNEIAMGMRKVVEMLDKIRDAASDAEVFNK